MDTAPAFTRADLAPFALYGEAWARLKDRYWLFLGISLVGVIVGGLAPLGLLMGPMMVGIYLCHRALARGEEVKFDLLFKGFDRFLEAFIATLVILGASLVIMVPLVLVVVFLAMFGVVGLAAAGSQTRGLEGGLAAGACLLYAGAFALVLLASLLASLFFTFTFPLLADRALPGLDAVKASCRAALANFRGLLVLGLATFVLTFAGLLLCYVGALLLMPLTLGVHWIAYERVFGRAEEDPAGEAGLADFPGGAG